MNVLVIGSTGLLGTEICRRLKANGHTVSGLVRAGSPKQATVKGLGVTVATGDLRDATSLDAALKGVETIVTTATAVTSTGSGNSLAAVDAAGHANLIAAAKRAGTKRFVFVSASPKYSDSCPLIFAKRATETALKASGLDYVIVQPSFFMDIWFSKALGWDLKVGKAQIFGAGDAPISFISIDDVAAYTVAVTEDLKVKNQEIPLGGPEAVTPRGALETIEKVAGKKFKVTTLPGFVPKMASMLLKPFNPKLASLMALGVETLTGDTIDLTKARSLANVKLTSVADWAKKNT
jgi:NADH dehydrogenase